MCRTQQLRPDMSSRTKPLQEAQHRPDSKLLPSTKTTILSFAAILLLALAVFFSPLADLRALAFASRARGTPSSADHLFCDGGDVVCIFDVGHNTGQDTLFYLRRDAARRGRQVRVVAVDANPVLMSRSVQRFAPEIRRGLLKLVTMGLVSSGQGESDNEAGQRLTFWVNTREDRFSSFKEQTGCRGLHGRFLEEGNHQYCKKIEVDTRSCAWLIETFGVPTYMKIDIEGMDEVCVRSVGTLPVAQRPQYMSIENVKERRVELFASLGYTKFKAVMQNPFDHIADDPELDGMSGPWGEQAEDPVTGKQWSSAAQLIARIPLPGANNRSGDPPAWYDLHVAK